LHPFWPEPPFGFFWLTPQLGNANQIEPLKELQLANKWLAQWLFRPPTKKMTTDKVMIPLMHKNKK
jgi:hypothetical protein